MHRSRALGFVLVLTVTAAATPGGADEPEAARALRLFQRGEAAQAAEILRRVLSRAPSPAVHRALASCYLKLGDDERAAEHLRAFLDGATAGPPREQAEARLREVSERLSTAPIVVTSVPAGARIFVDDGAAPVGVSPWSGRLPLGTHGLRIELDGHLPATVSASLRRGIATELPVTLSPRPREGRLRLTAGRPGVRFFVDGRPATGEPVVVAGPHRVRGELDGAPIWEQPVEVPAGEVVVVTPSFPEAIVPAPAPPTPGSVLRRPGWALLAVGGAGLIVGAGLYGGAAAAAERASGAEDPDTFFAHRGATGNLHGGAVASLVVGGLATVAGAALLVLDRTRREGRARVALAPGGRGLEVRFWW